MPAYPGVEKFVDAFDTLVVQPRRTRSRVPVVLLSEPGDGQAGRRIVAGLRSRLRGREGVSPRTPTSTGPRRTRPRRRSTSTSRSPTSSTRPCRAAPDGCGCPRTGCCARSSRRPPSRA
ncbi:hypothetical protein ACFQ60_41975 [Streptomyces zhihengii]